MKKKNNKKKIMKKRDLAILAHCRREINLSTRSESKGKKKFSRKTKHKTKYA